MHAEGRATPAADRTVGEPVEEELAEIKVRQQRPVGVGGGRRGGANDIGHMVLSAPRRSLPHFSIAMAITAGTRAFVATATDDIAVG